MSHPFLDIAVTPSVRAVQTALHPENRWSDFTSHRKFDRFSDQEAAFISELDSFYMATVSESGWPYVQHRGGPRGFLRLVDDRTLAFAEYRGNRQYITMGNLAANDRACLLLMDYARRARMKMYMHVDVLALDADPALTELVTLPGYTATLERVFRLRLESFDWNCPRHITRRFTEQEIAEAIHPLRERLENLEAENAALRTRLATQENSI